MLTAGLVIVVLRKALARTSYRLWRKVLWMAKNDSLKRKPLQPHFGQCRVTHRFGSFQDDAFYCRKNSVLMDHWPSAPGSLPFPFLDRENFLVGIDSLKALALDIGFCAMSFCSELNRPLSSFFR